jgi:hypothetical protein
MLPFPDVVHFLADKLARLRGWRLAFPGILFSSFDRFLVWHAPVLSASPKGDNPTVSVNRK